MNHVKAVLLEKSPSPVARQARIFVIVADNAVEDNRNPAVFYEMLVLLTADVLANKRFAVYFFF